MLGKVLNHLYLVLFESVSDWDDLNSDPCLSQPRYQLNQCFGIYMSWHQVVGGDLATNSLILPTPQADPADMTPVKIQDVFFFNFFLISRMRCSNVLIENLDV